MLKILSKIDTEESISLCFHPYLSCYKTQLSIGYMHLNVVDGLP